MADEHTRTISFPTLGLKMITLDDAEDEFFVEGILPRRGLAAIYGPPGSGKSFLALRMGLCVAAGIPFFGCAVTQMPVVYVAAEAGKSFKKRVVAARQHLGIRDAPFFLITRTPNLGYRGKDAPILIADIKRQTGADQPGLIILDTASRTMPGTDENKAAELSVWVQNVEKIGVAFEGLAVGVHHTGKDATRGMRGNSVFNGATDCELLTTSDDTTGIHTASLTKMRDGEDGLEFTFRLDQYDLGPCTTCIVQPLTEPGARQDRPKPKKAPTGQAKIALDALHEAIREMGTVPPGNNHIPGNTRTVTKTQWRDYARRRGITESDEPEAFKKAFQRAVTSLQSMSLVAIWGEQVWTV